MTPRLVRPLARLALLAAAALAACSADTTAPSLRLATITNIVVPDSAGSMDTVLISFDYFPLGCDPIDHVDERSTYDTVSFAVWTRVRNGPCPLDLIAVAAHPYAALVLPPRPSALTVIFREPDGKDSARVVKGPVFLTPGA